MRVRWRVDRLITLAAVVPASLVAGYLCLSVWRARPARVQAPQPRAIEGWDQLRAGGHRLGDTASVPQIVVFEDFECPACADLRQELYAIARRNPGLSIAYRHFPLPTHPNALPAAIASECAADQGRFQDFQELVFRAQDTLARVSWTELAAASGVTDLRRFRRCLAGPDAPRRVEADRALGSAVGVDGTPIAVVKGILFPAFPDEATVDSLLRADRSLTARRATELQVP